MSKHFKTDSPMSRIPPIVSWECQMLLAAYYGGYRQAAWAIFKYWFRVEFCHMYASRLRVKISDWMGWTHIIHYPETKDYVAHDERHGRHCEGYPYHEHSERDCFGSSIPKWYRWLTRWDR